MAEGGHSSLVERIARVLCAAELSSNAEGSEPSAGAHVNQHWPTHTNQALAVLRAIREPDKAATAVGDPDIWQRMVQASIDAVD